MFRRTSSPIIRDRESVGRRGQIFVKAPSAVGNSREQSPARDAIPRKNKMQLTRGFAAAPTVQDLFLPLWGHSSVYEKLSA